MKEHRAWDTVYVWADETRPKKVSEISRCKWEMWLMLRLPEGFEVDLVPLERTQLESFLAKLKGQNAEMHR